MALNAAVVWEVRTTGVDTNGGGFKAGASGTDYSLQDAPQLSITDLACAGGTAVVTSAAGNLTAQMIGNLIQIASGTNFTAGFYEIVGHTDANTITLDRDPTSGGAGSVGVAKIGGALLTIQKAVDNIVAGNDVYVLAGTYAGSTTINCDLAGVDSSDKNRLIGYKSGSRTTALTTDPPTGTDRPLVDMTSGTNNAIYVSVNHWCIYNIRISGHNKGGQGIRNEGTYNVFVNCAATDCSYGFLSQGLYDTWLNCYSNANTIGYYSDGGLNTFYYCRAHDCDEHGFFVYAYNALIHCIADTCGGATHDGFELRSNGGGIVIGCVAYKCGRHGIFISYAADAIAGTTILINNILAENGVSATGYGIAAFGSVSNSFLLLADYNAFYAGATQDGAQNNMPAGTHDVTLTGDPFTAAASDDFTLDNTASQGAACRGAGYPSYFDIGALQHQESGGGGSIFGGLVVR